MSKNVFSEVSLNIFFLSQLQLSNEEGKKLKRENLVPGFEGAPVDLVELIFDEWFEPHFEEEVKQNVENFISVKKEA